MRSLELALCAAARFDQLFRGPEAEPRFPGRAAGLGPHLRGAHEVAVEADERELPPGPCRRALESVTQLRLEFRCETRVDEVEAQPEQGLGRVGGRADRPARGREPALPPVVRVARRPWRRFRELAGSPAGRSWLAPERALVRSPPARRRGLPVPHGGARARAGLSSRGSEASRHRSRQGTPLAARVSGPSARRSSQSMLAVPAANALRAHRRSARRSEARRRSAAKARRKSKATSDVPLRRCSRSTPRWASSLRSRARARASGRRHLSGHRGRSSRARWCESMCSKLLRRQALRQRQRLGGETEPLGRIASDRPPASDVASTRNAVGRRCAASTSSSARARWASASSPWPRCHQISESESSASAAVSRSPASRSASRAASSASIARSSSAMYSASA